MGCGSSSPPPVENDPSRGGRKKSARDNSKKGKHRLGPEFDQFPNPLLLSEGQKAWHEKDLSPASGENGLPGPFPPPSTREEILSGVTFYNIDSHVRQAPAVETFHAVSELVEYLCKLSEDEVCKARALYMWLVSWDISRLRLKQFPLRGSPAYWLLRVAVGATSVAEFLEQLFMRANIPCKVLYGKIKDGHYCIGEDVLVSHSWCAIYVNNTWRHVFVPLQPTTGTNSTNNNSTNSNHVSRSLSRGFMVAPEELIYLIRTPELEWQLLGRPVTQDEFTDMAYLKEGFFANGFIDVSHPLCINEVEDGKDCLELHHHDDMSVYVKCHLRKLCSEDSTISSKGVPLSRFVHVEGHRGRKEIHIKFPDAGMYKLLVSAADPKRSDYKSEPICEYIFICRTPCFLCQPIIDQDTQAHGPGLVLQKYGLSPISHPNSHVETSTGQVKLQFEVQDKNYPMLSCDFYSQDHPKKSLDTFTLHYITDTEVGFFLKCTQIGKYVFKILALSQDNARGSQRHLCTYFIHALAASVDRTPFSDEKAGDLARNQVVRPISHPDPCVGVNGSEVAIEMEARSNVKLFGHVDYVTEQRTTAHSAEYQLVERKGTLYKFIIRFPYAGYYNLQIFTQSVKTSKSLSSHVHTYMLRVAPPKEPCEPYPWQVGDPVDDVHLIEPMSGALPENETSHFSVHVGGATNVYVTCGGRLHQELNMTDNDTWEGDVEPGEGGKELMLTADIKGKTYEMYLYKVLTQEELQEYKEQLDKELEQGETWKRDMAERTETAETEKTAREKQRQLDLEREMSEFEAKRESLQQAEESCRRKMHDHFLKCQTAAEEEESRLIELRSMSRDEVEDLMKEEFKRQRKGGEGDMYLRKQYTEMMESVLRENLKDATRRRHRDDLVKAIDVFKANTLPDKGDLTRAERTLDILIERDELRTAMMDRDYYDIKDHCHRIMDKGYVRPLQAELFQAAKLLEQLKRAGQRVAPLPNMDKATMAEIRGYKKPPYPIHEVMQAVFLLLGEDEMTTGEWISCQRLCATYSKEGLMKRMRSFDIEEVHPEIIARSREILDRISLQLVQSVSAGVATFYVWAMGMTQDMDDSMHRADDRSGAARATPADIMRQLEIFGRAPSETGSVWSVTPRKTPRAFSVITEDSDNGH